MSNNKILHNLINSVGTLDQIKLELKKLNWDDSNQISLSTHHVVDILNKFQNGELRKDDVEEWANLIEGRDDIEYDEKNYDDILQAIHILANPVLEGELNFKLAEKVKKMLL